MPRKPLPKLYRDGQWDFGPGAISDRPALAAIIGRCLGLWPDVELQTAILLSILLKADSHAATAVYLVLRRSTPRYDALTAAANATLTTARDKELFAAVLQVYRAAEAERNALAHGCYASSPRMPDSILWIESMEAARYVVDILRRETHNKWLPGPKSLGDKLFHYTAKDLEAIYDQIFQAHHIILEFGRYLRTSTAKEREAIYARLCNSASIREALRTLRASASQSKSATPVRLRPERRKPKQSR